MATAYFLPVPLSLPSATPEILADYLEEHGTRFERVTHFSFLLYRPVDGGWDNPYIAALASNLIGWDVIYPYQKVNTLGDASRTLEPRPRGPLLVVADGQRLLWDLVEYSVKVGPLADDGSVTLILHLTPDVVRPRLL
jgi:hypothetical protein